MANLFWGKCHNFLISLKKICMLFTNNILRVGEFVKKYKHRTV